MARETKLGMLVGLGFIICFAIILENRGRRDSVTPQMPHDVLAQSSASTPVSPTVTRQPDRDRNRFRQPQRRSAGRRAQSKQSTPSRRRAARNRPARPDPTRSNEARTQPKPAQDVVVETTVQPQPIREPKTTDTPRPPVVVDASQAKKPNEPKARQAILTATAAAAESAVKTKSPTPPPTPATRSGTKYTVQSGDSLSRVAARHYGSRSKRVIDAIFDANRAVMSSPDRIRVGQELLLPEVEGFTRSNEIARPPAPVLEETPKAEQRGNPRYYQIKKGDRYATIARDQLGDADRWREIAELNEDIFPDPSSIRYGVRIRLPGDARVGERS